MSFFLPFGYSSPMEKHWSNSKYLPSRSARNTSASFRGESVGVALRQSIASFRLSRNEESSVVSWSAARALSSSLRLSSTTIFSTCNASMRNSTTVALLVRPAPHIIAHLCFFVAASASRMSLNTAFRSMIFNCLIVVQRRTLGRH